MINLSAEERRILTNEARRQAASMKLESIKGQMLALGNAAQVLSSLSRDASEEFAIANQEVSLLQVGAGPGLSDEFGAYSSIDQLMRAERFAGKGASVDHVKTNPGCSEAEAVGAWRAAGLVATGLQVLLQDPEALGRVYRNNLMAARLVPDDTWESQRAWILATPKETIMGA